MGNLGECRVWVQNMIDIPALHDFCVLKLTIFTFWIENAFIALH